MYSIKNGDIWKYRERYLQVVNLQLDKRSFMLLYRSKKCSVTALLNKCSSRGRNNLFSNYYFNG